MIEILNILGAISGVLIGAYIGSRMARDVINDWSRFSSFLGGIGCYIVWIGIGFAVGFLTGPVSFPALVLIGPLYLGHRMYFNNKKDRY